MAASINAITGRKAKLAYAVSSSSTDVEFGRLQNYQVTVNQNIVDATNFDSSGWEENIGGRKSWGITAQAVHLSTLASHNALKEILSSGLSTAGEKWFTVQPTTSDTQEWAGYGRVLSYSLGAGSDEEIVLFNIEIKGTRRLVATS